MNMPTLWKFIWRQSGLCFSCADLGWRTFYFLTEGIQCTTGSAKKIKGLAIFFCILGIIGSVLLGIFVMLDGSTIAGRLASVNSNADNAIAIVAGVIIMVLGSLLSWIGTWLLYGYGELIDKVTDIEDELYFSRR